MKHIATVLSLIFCTALSSNAKAQSLNDDLMGNLLVLKTVYSSQYAPADWKHQFVGYDLEANYQQALATIRANPALTQKDSRVILKNFIYAMKDYHVGISFVSTETASLPLQIVGAGDRFFVGFIDRSKLPEATFPFHVGDEVTSFAGAPVLQAIAALQAETAANVFETDRALAEMQLTRRSAARGMTVPKGAIRIGFLRKGSTQESQIQLIWDYTPEKIAPRTIAKILRNDPLSKTDSFEAPAFLKPMMNVNFEVETAAKTVENPHTVGARKSYIPDLGPRVWESADDSTFHAYIYKNESGKLIGYVRIPSYVPKDYLKAVADFAAIVTRFESVTDALVIDQVNNPGGNVLYLYSLASMLTDAPLRTPQHRMALNQTDIAAAVEMLEKYKDIKSDEDAQKLMPAIEASGYPVSYELVQFQINFARFLISEWESGRRLTRPFWIGGVDQINPAKSHYTKPILLLTNPLDFSGGDFFPAILQDNERITVMGTRTAGAGGYVNDIKVPNNIGIANFRVTESIAERVSGNPIENLGVIPDVAYAITAEDRFQNYVPYIRAIHKNVEALLIKTSVPK